MTTIAFNYQDKQVAVDGRITAGSLIRSDSSDKTIKNEIGLWIFAGTTCDYELLSTLNHHDKSDVVPDCSAMLIKDGKVFGVSVEDDGTCLHSEYEYSTAFGSGSDFATAAMDFGKSAQEAVKYAMTRDVFTGGAVQIFDVETGNIII